MPTEMDRFLAEELALPAAPTTEELGDLTKLVAKQLELERVIDEIDAKRKEAAEMLFTLQEQLIPDLMASIGVKKFTLGNGMVVNVKEDVYASIRKDFTSQAIQWLEDNGLGGIVKDEVKVNFGKGAQGAGEVMRFCREHGYSAEEKQSVHPQTLKATVKEQLARGIEFPDTFFSTGPIRKAVVSLK